MDAASQRTKTRRNHLLFVLLCAAAGASTNSVAADEPQALRRGAQAGVRIATLDLAELVEAHPLHQDLVEALEEQAEFDRTQEERQQKRMKDLKRRLAEAEKGTREHKRIEGELHRLTLACELDLNAPRAQRFDRTGAMLRIFEDIRQTTARYCREHGIGLVLRRMPDHVDEEDPAAVDEILNRLVLYESDLDITEAILEQLKAGDDRQADE